MLENNGAARLSFFADCDLRKNYCARRHATVTIACEQIRVVVQIGYLSF
jgi:hypothetical protein